MWRITSGGHRGRAPTIVYSGGHGGIAPTFSHLPPDHIECFGRARGRVSMFSHVALYLAFHPRSYVVAFRLSPLASSVSLLPHISIQQKQAVRVIAHQF